MQNYFYPLDRGISCSWIALCLGRRTDTWATVLSELRTETAETAVETLAIPSLSVYLWWSSWRVDRGSVSLEEWKCDEVREVSFGEERPTHTSPPTLNSWQWKTLFWGPSVYFICVIAERTKVNHSIFCRLNASREEQRTTTTKICYSLVIQFHFNSIAFSMRYISSGWFASLEYMCVSLHRMTFHVWETLARVLSTPSNRK
jgi:hypothetical protein